MPVICGGECTGRRHPGSGNDGMPDGFWSKAGLRWRWPRRWDGMPIPLAGGLPSSARAVRRRWPSSSRVVPPRDRRSAVDRTAGSGAGVSSKGWPRLGQLELEGGAQICAGTFRGLPKPQQLPESPCPASTIFAGWRQSVLPVHLLGLAPLLGSVGPVAGDVKLQDDGVVHDPGQSPRRWPWGWQRCAPTPRRPGLT